MAEKKGKRNILLVYLFSIITLGVYYLYWMVSSKNEMNEAGAKIPPSWLMIVPIANFYWIYKYAEGFSQKIKKDNNSTLWFILFLFVGIVTPAIVQSELNNLDKQQKEAKQNGLGGAGFTLGLLSIISFGVPGLIMSIIGFILSVIQQKKRPTDIGETGLILCIIGFILSSLYLIWVFLFGGFQYLQSLNASLPKA